MARVFLKVVAEPSRTSGQALSILQLEIGSRVL